MPPPLAPAMRLQYCGTDTIAGRAAMLAGALRGTGSVPEDWKRLFKDDTLERIRRNAARFTEVVIRRLDGMRRRQAAAGA